MCSKILVFLGFETLHPLKLAKKNFSTYFVNLVPKKVGSCTCSKKTGNTGTVSFGGSVAMLV